MTIMGRLRPARPRGVGVRVIIIPVRELEAYGKTREMDIPQPWNGYNDV